MTDFQDRAILFDGDQAVVERDSSVQKEYSKSQGWTEIHRKKLDFSVQEFWKRFWCDDSEFSMKHFFSRIDYSNIQESKWQAGRKSYSLTIPVYNIPFCRQADATIECSLIENSPTKLVIDNHFESKDSPYGDTFFYKDVWIVLKSGEDQCIFYHVAKVEFVKSTIMKEMLAKSSMVGIVWQATRWLEKAEEFGFLKPVEPQSKMQQALVQKTDKSSPDMTMDQLSLKIEKLNQLKSQNKIKIKLSSRATPITSILKNKQNSGQLENQMENLMKTNDQVLVLNENYVNNRIKYIQRKRTFNLNRSSVIHPVSFRLSDHSQGRESSLLDDSQSENDNNQNDSKIESTFIKTMSKKIKAKRMTSMMMTNINIQTQFSTAASTQSGFKCVLSPKISKKDSVTTYKCQTRNKQKLENTKSVKIVDKQFDMFLSMMNQANVQNTTKQKSSIIENYLRRRDSTMKS